MKRIWLWRVVSHLAAGIAGAILGLFCLYIAIASNLPDLRPWHAPLAQPDFGPDDYGQSWEHLLEVEAKLFRGLDAMVARRAAIINAEGQGPTSSFNRFDSMSPSNPALHTRNWNRTIVFDPPQPRGGVLLLHGLSDSPYSLRAAAETFRDEGFYVLNLRVPGHGTVPGQLVEATARDWREAVEIAARQVGKKIGRSSPFFIVGYSNGGALATEYAVRALSDPELALPRPDMLLLFAPALGVTRTAALASFQRRLATIPLLEKLEWTSVLPEFDPYKFSSFPVAAGEQIHLLTTKLDTEFRKLQKQNGLVDFPKVIVFQSLVDSTLPAKLIVERLLARLPVGKAELVLFDVNRVSHAEDFLAKATDTELERLLKVPELSFDLTFLTNISGDQRELVIRSRPAGASRDPESWSVEASGLSWPKGVFSLSHVAMPIRRSDPIYGVGDGEGAPDDPRDLRLGASELRGEKGVLGIPIEQLMRLRYNPFYPYIDGRIREAIAASVSEEPGG